MRKPFRVRALSARHAFPTFTGLLCVLWLSGCSAPPDEQPREGAPDDRTTFLDPVTWDEWLLPVRDSVGRSPQPQAAPCRLFVREVGAGPRVVLLHGGWGADHEDLLYGFLPLADDLRLTFYDQRGSLRSPCDSLPTADDHVADVEALRQALGEERLVLAAHSMGTWLAMAYAERHPERVAGLILMGPVWPTPDAPGSDGQDAPPRWERPAVAAELEAQGLSLDRRKEDGPLGWSINHRVIFAAVNLHDVTKWKQARPPWAYSSDAANSAAESMPESFDFRPALAALDVPVLVIQGDDEYLPQATWTADVEGVELETVENAGHLLYVDRPDAVRSLLREYVLGLER